MTKFENGTIVTSQYLHGVRFGTIGDVRDGWARGIEREYRVDHLHGYTWIGESRLAVATIGDVQEHYDYQLRSLRGRIQALAKMVGKKVPKYNPEKHLDDLAKFLCSAYRHEDGSITYITGDPMPGDTENPRSFDGNVATMVQINSRCIDVDEDEAGLWEAHNRFTEPLMRRYLAMFRPDVLYYADHWSASDSYGWGYVTKENWDKWMGEGYDGDVTPEQAFDAEVKVYDLWARGEVFISAHVTKRGGEVEFCHGHLGYDKNEDIAMSITASPILEVLA